MIKKFTHLGKKKRKRNEKRKKEKGTRKNVQKLTNERPGERIKESKEVYWHKCVVILVVIALLSQSGDPLLAHASFCCSFDRKKA